MVAGITMIGHIDGKLLYRKASTGPGLIALFLVSHLRARLKRHPTAIYALAQTIVQLSARRHKCACLRSHGPHRLLAPSTLIPYSLNIKQAHPVRGRNPFAVCSTAGKAAASAKNVNTAIFVQDVKATTLEGIVIKEELQQLNASGHSPKLGKINLYLRISSIFEVC